MPNKLAQERSLYLRQHAANPVDWQPWGPDAFALAGARDCPVFISSGYSSCHWCHVMAHECFEDDNVADLLNANFVAIKLDREEHPGIDAQYMTAVMLIQGHGGWPMSVFALPDGRPFFAGTYFPKTPRHGQPGFIELLQRIAEIWRGERDRLLADATQVTEGVRVRSLAPAPAALSPEGIHTAIADSLASHDSRYGGHLGAPKFPPHVDLRLWQYCRCQKLTSAELETAWRLTLDRLCWSGLRDQVGGGFHRYCVDEGWRVPHFEQMLYDNAQMLDVLATATLLDNDDADRYVLSSLVLELSERWQTPGGWCAAAWDADDAGGEGGYYTWTPDELREALLDDAPWAAKFYRVEAHGPVDGRSTLYPPFCPSRPDDDQRPEDLWPRVRHSARLLLEARKLRPAPARDDKGIVSENGLLLAALAKAARALGLEKIEPWSPFAAALLDKASSEQLPRAWYADESRGIAGLEDYAGLGLGLLRWGLTFDSAEFLQASLHLARHACSRFSQPTWTPVADDTLFQPLSSGKNGTVGRLATAAIYQDGQNPSPLALTVDWMCDLHAATGDDTWRLAADEIVHQTSGAMMRMPAATRDLWRAYHRYAGGHATVFLAGLPTDDWYRRLCGRTSPELLWIRPRCASWLAAQNAPALQGRSGTAAYYCQGATCQQPATSLSQLAQQLGVG